ncbi:hypothetical protein DICSQDRAFT_129795 [Dichomitus squalens LYAD-421 SS1]|uniref:Uncharacterized protein n=1 Tax=Dichomitus squalens (strain LYAD-421) TaxID=732165 RepID=R7SLA5_DICSQ|nr:uncharacterized protein DICSQDRAFT_129795 [Dichomitus squalens LYAD-421 SS1]EJF56941.1 hypothetical protein DICSQDRAFT_129795 [Dichomitus squalens LYAD-421 SS1]
MTSSSNAQSSAAENPRRSGRIQALSMDRGHVETAVVAEDQRQQNKEPKKPGNKSSAGRGTTQETIIADGNRARAIDLDHPRIAEWCLDQWVIIYPAYWAQTRYMNFKRAQEILDFIKPVNLTAPHANCLGLVFLLKGTDFAKLEVGLPNTEPEGPKDEDDQDIPITEAFLEDGSQEPISGWMREPRKYAQREPPAIYRKERVLKYPRFPEFDRIVKAAGKSTAKPIHKDFGTATAAYIKRLTEALRKPEAVQHCREIHEIITQVHEVNSTVAKLGRDDPSKATNAFRDRLSGYPPTGRCDGLYMLVDYRLFEDIREQDIRRHGKEVLGDEEIEDILRSLNCASSGKSRSSLERAKNGWKVLIRDDEDVPKEEERTDNGARAFRLPFFVVENKTDDEDKERVAENQRLEYCVSILKAIEGFGDGWGRPCGKDIRRKGRL